MSSKLKQNLLKSYEEVIRGWREAGSEHFQFTSTVTLQQFAVLAGRIVYDDSYANELYEMLRAAYPSEGDLTREIDRVGKFFDRRIQDLESRDQKWTSYQNLRTNVSAVNRALNDMSSDSRKQILVVLISHELVRSCR